MAKDSNHQGIKLVTNIHGIDLTNYLKTVGDLFAFGASPGESDIEREVDRIVSRLGSLPVTAKRDVYVTVIAGSAGLYMSARKVPLWFIRYLAIRRVVEGDLHYDPPHESILYDLELGQIGRLGTVPPPTAAVAVDIPRVIKTLKSGGAKMPELSIDEVSEKLTDSDMTLLLMALPQFARECSARN